MQSKLFRMTKITRGSKQEEFSYSLHHPPVNFGLSPNSHFLMWGAGRTSTVQLFGQIFTDFYLVLAGFGTPGKILCFISSSN